jgi:YHS domain-containing protein
MDKKAQWALVGAAWFLAGTVALFGWLAWQRFGVQKDPAAALRPAADGTVRCPVTGEALQALSSTPQLVYQGQTYYFSAAKDAEGRDARTRFLMQPELYLHPSAVTPIPDVPAPAASASAPATPAPAPAAPTHG